MVGHDTNDVVVDLAPHVALHVNIDVVTLQHLVYAFTTAAAPVTAVQLFA